MKLAVTIPGRPEQQGSKKVFNRRAVEANKNLAPWRADAIHHIQQAMAAQLVTQFVGPVRVIAGFYYARPAGHYGTGRNAGIVKPSAPVFKESAPDLDKLQRALGDALTQAGAIRDDARIVAWDVDKLWAETSSVRLTIEQVES